jgi:ATP-dependent DNA helicase PIF1
MEELSHNQQDLCRQSISLYSQLNEDQRSVYDTVLHIVCLGEHFTGFVSGHGGTGKTFLWRAIMKTLRSRGHIVLAVASSGVASLLLPGGRTAHSRFRIPLDLHEESRCAIARGTNLAELLCRASLIIWENTS